MLRSGFFGWAVRKTVESPRYPGSAEPAIAVEFTVDVGVVVEVVERVDVVELVGVVGAFGVPVSEGGGVGLLVPVGVEDTGAELPFVGDVVGGAEVFGAVPVVVAEGVLVGDASGVPVGVVVGATGPVWLVRLVSGRGRGVCGPSAARSWGSRRKPMPSPATARTEPTALCTARARRRAWTPARRRLRCCGSKGVCSWESRIIRASSCSK